MLRNVLASSSKEDLENLFNDGQTGKLKLPIDGLFEIWCKLYDKSYTSQQEKLYRLTVFEDNLKCVMDFNKRKNDWLNKGANTLKVYNSYRDLSDRTPDELDEIRGTGLISDEKMEELYVSNLFCLICFHYYLVSSLYNFL